MHNIITIDFETYYSKEYGLNKLTTEEYIRDERFEIIGVAVKENGGQPIWKTGTHEEIREFLANYNWEDSFVVGHNLRFDGAILNWIFGIKPKGLIDTMSMATIVHGLTESVSLKNLAVLYNIGEKGTEVLDAKSCLRADFTDNQLTRYGSYCINDVKLTHSLFLKMLPLFNQNELKLIDLTMRMFTEPCLRINKILLVKHLNSVRDKKQKLLEKANVDKKILMSNPKFAELLKSLSIDPPMKISPTTGKPTFAFAKTDIGFKDLLDHPDERVQILSAARVGNRSTIEETRTENFINIANRGLLPVPLKYSGAVVSHRWSGGDGINMQNLPRTSELRRAIYAPSGFKIVVSDLSNIELRLAYWFSNSQDKVEQIRNGVDLYTQSASDITGTPYDEVDKDLRYIFKVVNLSGIYGVGANKMHSILMQGGVDRDLDEVKNIIYAFRRNNPQLVEAWNDAKEMLTAILNGHSYRMGAGGIIESYDSRYYKRQNSRTESDGSSNSCTESSHSQNSRMASYRPQPGLNSRTESDGILNSRQGMLKPNGMLLGLPNLRIIKTKEGRETWAYDKKLGRKIIPEYIHPAKTFQRCIQSLARDIIGEHLLAVARKYKVVMTVHDELVMVCPDDEVDNCVEYVRECMQSSPEWCLDLPLDCEIGVGDNYMDAK